MNHRIAHLAAAVGELQGRLRLAAEDRAGKVGKALADAADLLERADQLLVDADLAMAGRSSPTSQATSPAARRGRRPIAAEQLTLFE